MPNLAEGLRDELGRCTDLLEAYTKIGPAGAFGAMMIRMRIDGANAAIASGDIIAMLKAYQVLKACE